MEVKLKRACLAFMVDNISVPLTLLTETSTDKAPSSRLICASARPSESATCPMEIGSNSTCRGTAKLTAA